MILYKIQINIYLNACYYVTPDGCEYPESLFLQNRSANTVEKSTAPGLTANSCKPYQSSLLLQSLCPFCERQKAPVWEMCL
jgi:hypothetical protein